MGICISVFVCVLCTKRVLGVCICVCNVLHRCVCANNYYPATVKLNVVITFGTVYSVLMFYQFRHDHACIVLFVPKRVNYISRMSFMNNC